MFSTGAQILLQRLHAHGVDTLFGYPGGAILPVYEALRVAREHGWPLRHILVRHEQAAVFAAEGYARSTGRLGVALATSGPGATNLITGIANAMADSIPLLVITGQVPTTCLGTEAFQEVDIVHATAKMTKWAVQVRNAETLADTIDEAILRAVSGRPGPVLLDLPKDVQTGRGAFGRATPSPPRSQEGTLAWRAQALEMMQRAQRPLLFTGGGIRSAGATPALRTFAARSGIPQVNSLLGLGNCDLDDPLWLGMVGMFGTPAANEAVTRCDLLIALGVRFDDRATCDISRFAADAKVIHIDIDPRQLGRRRTAELAICSDLAEVWPAFSDAPTCPTVWQQWCRKMAAEAREFKSSRHLPSEYPWLRALDDALPAGAYISCDVGNHQMWAARCIRFGDPRHHLTSGGLGSMGFGLPAAMGAQIAQPDATVVSITGDGSFLMNVQELATLARYRLPIKILLLDNRSLGMVRQQQATLYGGDSENDLSDNPDFVAVARAFGVQAWSVHASESPDRPLERLLSSCGPALLHVQMDDTAGVWPWVPPASPIHPMVDRP